VTFAQYQQDLGPFRDAWGRAWARAFGTIKDREVTRARDAVLVGAVTRCGADALPRHGADTALERYAPDTDATYRARLVQAHDLWGWAGTPYGWAHALSLTSAQIRGARFVAQHQWSSAPDGFTTLWSRFWVYVWTGTLTVGRFTVGPWATLGASASPYTFLVVGSFTVGPDVLVGVNMTPAQLGEIRRALAKWKSARDRVPALGITDGAIVGMPGLYVGGFTVGGTLIRIAYSGGGVARVGDFTVGATPTTVPDGPWFPYVGRPLPLV
jgi:hypothetical protein